MSKLFSMLLSAATIALCISSADALTIPAGDVYNPTTLNCDPANSCSLNSTGQYVFNPLDNDGELVVATGNAVLLPSTTSDNGAGTIELHGSLEVSGPMAGQTIYFYFGDSLTIDAGGAYANGTVLMNWNTNETLTINGSSITVGPFVVASPPVNNATTVSWLGMAPGQYGSQVLVSVDGGSFSLFGCTALANVLGQEQATWLQHGHNYTFELVPSNGCSPQSTQSPVAFVTISD